MTKINNKKVNILTFNSALSYGAVLQTYALSLFLQRKGFQVEIIDFRVPFLTPMPLKIWILKAYYNFRRLKKYLVFKKFSKKFLSNKTKSFLTIKSIMNSNFYADYYIVGSDQVWNPDITKENYLIYFFSFLKNKEILISYAASFGNSDWNYDETVTNKVQYYLKRFKAISVREKSAISILENKFKISSEFVLDPTLLLNDFNELLPQFTTKDQIVGFKLENDIEFLDFTLKLGQIANLMPVVIDTNLKMHNLLTYSYPSVLEWLKFIAESKLVVTDSFHGIAFCLIYKKDFIVIKGNLKRFSRINDLLTILNLTDRIIDNYEDERINQICKKEIDYNIIDLILDEYRQKSEFFLYKYLNS